MSVETAGYPHCGERTDVPVPNEGRITEVKRERSLFDAPRSTGIDVRTVECPAGHEFCLYRE